MLSKHPKWSRRTFISTLAGIPLMSQITANAISKSDGFPLKSMFGIKGTFLNAAYTHPMSVGSASEINKFLNARMMNRDVPVGYDGFERASVAADFAKLINASPDELAWIPSTMFGENLIVAGLGLPGSKGHVVTDAFHFHGSLHLYNELEKQGVKVTTVKPHNNSIDLNDLDTAITSGTKLVALSLVSATTGYAHDLKKVCDLAHSRGALVYADIIQAAGAVPIDVRATGVDFCACATYKWLMGDFGIGFLYVRRDRLPLIKRSLIGYRQMKSSVSHSMPFDPPGIKAFESSSSDDMSGHFEVGTFANEGIAALRYSLNFLNTTGTDKITQYRTPMIDKLQAELPSFGYLPLTPTGSLSPIVCFALKDGANKLKQKLASEDITISLYPNYIRISPSFYNDMEDVDRLLSVLKSV